MGFLSGLTKKIFGGMDDSAQKAQQQANSASQKFIEEQQRLARGDANYLYSQGDYARNTGINSAMALMGRSMPIQMGMFQDGNVAAQSQLLAGLPQYQNAILGMPINNQAMQPTKLNMPDASFYQQKLPDFGMAQAPPPGQPWGTPQSPMQNATRQGPPAQQGQQGIGQDAANNIIQMLLGGGVR